MYQIVCASGSPAELLRQHPLQIDRGARRKQAMVVVDKIRKPVVDTLMVGYVRIGCVDAHRLGHDLRQRPPTPQQFIVDAAAAFLIAGEHAIFELPIEPSRFLTAVCCCCGLRWHEFLLLGRGRWLASSNFSRVPPPATTALPA